MQQQRLQQGPKPCLQREVELPTCTGALSSPQAAGCEGSPAHKPHLCGSHQRPAALLPSPWGEPRHGGHRDHTPSPHQGPYTRAHSRPSDSSVFTPVTRRTRRLTGLAGSGTRTSPGPAHPCLSGRNPEPRTPQLPGPGPARLSRH